MPERSPASVTTSTCESAAMTEFLFGNAHLLGPAPQRSSESTAPPEESVASKTSWDEVG